MYTVEDLHSLHPYGLPQSEKEKILSEIVTALCKKHYKQCDGYRKIVDGLGKQDWGGYYGLPFLPVRLFKSHELKDMDDKDCFKIMTSSGTTGQAVSRVFLDKETALLQQKVLLRILSDIVGKKRHPLLMVDSPDALKDRKLFSARGAALMSIAMMGRDVAYILNPDMSLNIHLLKGYLEKHKGEDIVMFGMTFMVWQHFYQELVKLDEKLDMPNVYLLQSGGWKKLSEESVSREVFKESLNRVCGIEKFSDHYSMSEQNGSVYAECKYGHYHASIYSDVIIRNPKDFSVCGIGEEGIIQVVSCCPQSYPGNSLLTEDWGMVEGVDDCPCGRKGKYIKVLGRMREAEIRGCGDTYAESLQ